MTTPKLGLPELVANQSQPHLTVNSALRRAEGSIQLSVLDRALNTPPVSPAEGDAYIVGAAPTGLWSAYSEGDVAFYSGGAWLRLAPLPGWLAFVQDEELFYYVSPAVSPPAWTILETGGGGSPAPGGGLESYQAPTYWVWETLATPPGAPDPGDNYRVDFGATGAWAGFVDGNIAHWDGAAWFEIAPEYAALIYNDFDTSIYILTNGPAASPRSWDLVTPLGGGGGNGEEPVYVNQNYLGVIPDGEIVFRWFAPRGGRIQADFLGSLAVDGTSPDADWTAAVWAGATQIGTILVASAGGVTLETTSNEEQYFAAGETILVIGDTISPDTGPEDLQITLQLILETP